MQRMTIVSHAITQNQLLTRQIIFFPLLNDLCNNQFVMHAREVEMKFEI
jgi:hypothetical protein